MVDGDTIIVKKGATKLTIRLVGIGAPEVSHKKYEPGQPFGQQSTKHLAGLVLNKNGDIKSHGPDRYGRTLGEVFLDGNNINLRWSNQVLLKSTEALLQKEGMGTPLFTCVSTEKLAAVDEAALYGSMAAGKKKTH